MEWQTVQAATPDRAFAPDDVGAAAKPPATGAWREGDPAGHRRFIDIGELSFERGGSVPRARMAYEMWGTLSPARDNAVLVLHALTGDSHAIGDAGGGHPTSGWWEGMIGPGCAIDTKQWFVIAPNVLGGCQGSTGPSSMSPDGREWGPRFPFTTIRDQVVAQMRMADALGIDRWAAVVGGSMGGMHALEWAIMYPERVSRLAVIAAPPVATAEQIALNSLQIEAIRSDPGFRAGNYYGADDGEGPHRGLALARRLALLNYRSTGELNTRFQRSWQSELSPLGGGGRFAVQSYLDFHGNKFTRRFDANSYITLVEAMNSHDIGRGRGGVAQALGAVSARSLVIGIDSDRLFPVAGQAEIAASLRNGLEGQQPVIIASAYGHDGFLLETELISRQLNRLLDS
jgi:homoserine O-acetyltransferase/O-succinyltransferase